ncbi:MAG TPA: DMT family transporter [Ktedonobacterales bacterium]|nr:DMT family transporter [Ktedonobacterales bacterium]
METTARHSQRGLINANIATLFFGLAGTLGKLSGLPAPMITLGRVVFAGLALGIWAALAHVSLRPHTRRDLALMALQGLVLAIHWTSFFQAIVVSNVAIGLLAFSSFPLFTAALEPLLLHQRPRPIEVIAAILILPGIFLLAPRFSLDNHATQGVLWGLLAGATFALLSVVNRSLSSRYSSVTISFYQDGVAALALLPTIFLARATQPISVRSLLILVILGVFCTALAHTVFIASLSDITAQLASVVAATEPVWGIGFAWLLLAEAPTARTFIGGAFIVGAALLPGVVALLRQRPS